MMMASNPNSKLITNKNTRRYLLDFLTASMGGFLFVVAVVLFESGAPDDFFRLFREILNSSTWRFGSYNLNQFIFAFIITYIIIFIRNQYKKT